VTWSSNVSCDDRMILFSCAFLVVMTAGSDIKLSKGIALT
jgi:hypothetical protein